MKFNISNIEEYLEMGFERSLFKASVAYLSNINDQLRFNSFAYSMRELYRHVLFRLSPEEQILQCEWFNVKDSNEGKSTRKQKLIYAIQGGLTHKYVKEILEIEIDEFWSKIGKSQDLLSKYTHVNRDTFDISNESCDEFSSQVLEALWTIFESVTDARSKIISQLHQNISNELISAFISSTISEIDILSTHSCVDDVDVEEYQIIEIDSTNIYFLCYGNVHVSLNYGSSNDEPTELLDEFPFEVKFFSPIHNPQLIQIDIEQISIDTSSWFGDDDDEDVSDSPIVQVEYDGLIDF